jgi:Flp pilus assembly pilin Flp
MTLLHLYKRIADRLPRDEEGAVTAEYGIIVLGVVAASIAAMVILGEGFNTLYEAVEAILEGPF